jgi:hypothetical protein
LTRRIPPIVTAEHGHTARGFDHARRILADPFDSRRRRTKARRRPGKQSRIEQTKAFCSGQLGGFIVIQDKRHRRERLGPDHIGRQPREKGPFKMIESSPRVFALQPERHQSQKAGDNQGGSAVHGRTSFCSFS